MKLVELALLALVGVGLPLVLGGCLQVDNSCDDPKNDAHETLGDILEDGAESIAAITPMCLDVDVVFPLPGPGQL